MPVAAALAQQGNDDSGTAASFREKLILSEAAIKGLTDSLAVANGETELFKRKYDDLNSRVEALGIAPAGKEAETLRTRLLSAVRDMRLLQKENDTSREQLIRLTEAVMDLLKTSEGIDAKSRLKVEQELRTATKLPAAASFKHVSPAGAAIGLPLTEVERQVYMVDDMPALSPIAVAYARARGTATACSCTLCTTAGSVKEARA